MSKSKKMLRVSLQFFAEGTGTEGNAAVAPTADGGSGSEFASRVKQLQEKYNVDFGFGTGGEAVENGVEGRPANGKNANGENADAPSESAESEFEKLITGKYREQYEKKSSERTAEAIKKRFKANAAAEKENLEKTSKYEKALSRMARHYGKDKSDFSGIAEAAINDDKWFEDEAFEKNVSPKALREAEDTSEELDRLKSRLSAQEREVQRQETFKEWSRQSKITKENYPSFDEQREFRDPKFLRALKFHGNVEDAYVATHFKELLAATAKAVENRTSENVTKLLTRGKTHPAEGAAGARAAVRSSVDPSKLSRRELAEYRRMIDRGEDPFKGVKS